MAPGAKREAEVFAGDPLPPGKRARAAAGPPPGPLAGWLTSPPPPRPTRSDSLVSDARASFAGVACHHCGRDCREAPLETPRGVSDGAGVTCHGCWQRFCALCSMLNYDAREDRAFCLDCEAARRADAAAGHPRCGAPGGRTHHDASVWGY